jgi:hypothetical protein
LTEAKVIAGLAILIAVLGLGALGYRAVYDSGRTAGANSVQTQWDADKAAIAKTTAAAIAQMTKQRDDALNANEAIHDTYETELSAANANSDALLKRVRQYEASFTAHSGSVPKAGSGPGPADPGQESSGQSVLDSHIVAYDTACQSDAAQLNALIGELKPQL